MSRRFDIADDPSLLDPKQLKRMVKEWRILRSAVRESPIPFVVYDEEDRIIEWNLAYEANHQKGFDTLREAAEDGTVTYRDLMRFQLDPELPVAEQEALLDARVHERRATLGQSQQVLYIGTGHHKVYRYQLPTGALAGFAMDINDLVESQRRLSEARAEAEAATQRLQEAHNQIEQYAFYDELTGLPNRRFLMSKLTALRADPSMVGTDCVVLHIDLDWFKQVNDLLGHAAGDQILRKVGEILQEECRPNDVAVRVGGDEFALVLIGECDSALGGAIAERIIERLKNRIYFKSTPCRISASVGISQHNLDNVNLEEIFLPADLAMYRAKQNGGNRVEFFSNSLQQDIRAKGQIREQLVEALRDDQFVAYYQPQFSCADGGLIGAEALCRWRDNQGTIHAPGDFIDIATQNSLLGEIDRRMYFVVSEDLEWMRAQGFDLPKIALNIGFERLLDPSLISDLVSLKAHGREVAVELIETLSLDDLSPEFSRALSALRDNGIQIEIDDFGSKRASINSLVSVSPSVMKIDKKIVLPGPRSPKMRELISAIVEISKALDIGVLAEGVETEAHADMVRSLGCDYMQGFALAMPMTREETLKFLSLLQADGLAA